MDPIWSDPRERRTGNRIQKENPNSISELESWVPVSSFRTDSSIFVGVSKKYFPASSAPS